MIEIKSGTKSNEIFVLEKLGFKDIENKNFIGNHVVKINVLIPNGNLLSGTQKEELKNILNNLI